MAKKKKKKSKGTKRKSSRVSGLDTTLLLSVVAGVVGGAFLDKGIKMIPGAENLNPYMIGGGKIAIGVGLPFLVKDGKTKTMLTAAGAGLAAVGALNIITETGILSGVDDLTVDLTPGRMNANVLGGIDDLGVMNADVLGEADDLSVVNGMY